MLLVWLYTSINDYNSIASCKVSNQVKYKAYFKCCLANNDLYRADQYYRDLLDDHTMPNFAILCLYSNILILNSTVVGMDKCWKFYLLAWESRGEVDKSKLFRRLLMQQFALRLARATEYEMLATLKYHVSQVEISARDSLNFEALLAGETVHPLETFIVYENGMKSNTDIDFDLKLSGHNGLLKNARYLKPKEYQEKVESVYSNIQKLGLEPTAPTYKYLAACAFHSRDYEKFHAIDQLRIESGLKLNNYLASLKIKLGLHVGSYQKVLDTLKEFEDQVHVDLVGQRNGHIYMEFCKAFYFLKEKEHALRIWKIATEKLGLQKCCDIFVEYVRKSKLVTKHVALAETFIFFDIQDGSSLGKKQPKSVTDQWKEQLHPKAIPRENLKKIIAERNLYHRRIHPN